MGVEVASPGAFPVDQTDAFANWYRTEPNGRTVLTPPIPEDGNHGFKVPGFIPRAARGTVVRGTIQGKDLKQYDFTKEQYAALTRLTATLCTVFPKLKCDYPRQKDGSPVREKLDDATLKDFQGVLGHYHIQTDKVDPGPAFDWQSVVGGAKKLMRSAR